jgi:hypothetical protein
MVVSTGKASDTPIKACTTVIAQRFMVKYICKKGEAKSQLSFSFALLSSACTYTIGSARTIRVRPSSSCATKAI